MKRLFALTLSLFAIASASAVEPLTNSFTWCNQGQSGEGYGTIQFNQGTYTGYYTVTGTLAIAANKPLANMVNRNYHTHIATTFYITYWKSDGMGGVVKVQELNPNGNGQMIDMVRQRSIVHSETDAQSTIVEGDCGVVDWSFVLENEAVITNCNFLGVSITAEALWQKKNGVTNAHMGWVTLPTDMPCFNYMH